MAIVIAGPASRLEAAPLKDAYFQLVFYPVVGAALMNGKHLYAAQSLEVEHEHDIKALSLALASTQAHEAIQRLTRSYNEDIAGGKWKRMMDAHPRRRPVFNMPRVATDDTPTNNIATQATPTNALFTILATNFIATVETTNARIATLPGFGQGAVTIEPITAPSVAAEQAAGVHYAATQIPAGSYTATFHFLPTSAIHKGRGLRAAVRINGGKFQELDLNAQEYSPEWSANVLRGCSERTISFMQTAGEQTQIEVRFLDPGLVLLAIDFR